MKTRKKSSSKKRHMKHASKRNSQRSNTPEQMPSGSGDAFGGAEKRGPLEEGE
jgi:hypothetical protein